MTSSTVRVFVNEQGVTVPAGATALDAVRLVRPDDAQGIADGRLALTDSRGLPVAADVVPASGAIFRVVSNRDRTLTEPA